METTQDTPLNINTSSATSCCKSTRWVKLIAHCSLLASIGLNAQVTTGDSAPAKKEEVIELSPFVVTAAEDNGYIATQSLAGTRIKSDLKDVAASIQVVTKDLMEDLNATNINDLLLFTTGTETGGLSGNFSGAEFPSGGRVDSTNAVIDPSGANRVRGLGAPDRTRDYVVTNVPFDTYNTDRVDISRGANSILFGLGSPAGVINHSLIKATLSKDQTELKFRVSSGSDDKLSMRTSLDINKVLKKGVFGIRFAVLNDHKVFAQHPAFNNDERQYGTFTLRPFAKTTIRAGWETGRIIANNPDALAPIESISNYIRQLRLYQQAGADTSLSLYHDAFNTFIKNTDTILGYTPPDVKVSGFKNPLSQQGTNLFKNIALVYDNKNSSTPSYAFQTAVQNGDITNKQNYLNASGNVLPSAYKPPSAFGTAQYLGVNNIGQDIPNWSRQSLTDLSLYDFAHHLLGGTAGRSINHFNSGFVTLEQNFWKNRAGVEVAYSKEDTHPENFLPFRGENGSIRLDVNKTLTTGKPNPNFGRPYVVDRLNINDTKIKSDTLRATAYGTFDFAKDWLHDSLLGRMLGQHTATALYSKANSSTRRTTIQEAWTSRDPVVQGILDSSIGVKAFQRQVSYLDYIGPAVDILSNPAALSMSSFVIDPDPIVNQAIPAPSGIVPVTVWSKFNPNEATYDLERHPYVRSGVVTETGVESYAGVLQSRLFDDIVVSTIGLRQDKQTYRNNNNPPLNPEDPLEGNFTTDPRYFTVDGITPVVSTGRTKTYSLVLNLPKKWRNLPGGTEVSFFYGQSDNIQPDPSRLNQYLDIIDPPTGKTKEMGINLSLLNGKAHLRLNHYESEVTNVSNGRLGSIFQSALVESTFRELQFAFDQLHGFVDTGDAAKANYTKVPEMINQIAGLYGAHIDIDSKTITTDPNHPYAKVWEVNQPSLIIDPITGGIQSFFYRNVQGLADTQDSRSKGYEVELTVNATKAWRMHFNVAQQKTETANSLPNVTQLIADFGPVIYGAPGNPSFVGGFVRNNPINTPTGAAGTTNADFWQNSVLKGYYNVTALDGTTSPEERQWRANFVTNYSVQSGRFKGVSFGGSARWQDKVAIGYPLVLDSFGNFVPDRGRPYYGSSEINFGLRMGYSRKIFHNRINWSVSLNVDNVTNKPGDLIAVQAQPDGSIAQVRVAPPRTWALTNTLRF